MCLVLGSTVHEVNGTQTKEAFRTFQMLRFFSSLPHPGESAWCHHGSGGSTCLCLCGRRSTQHRSSGICSLPGGNLRVQQLCIPGAAELAPGTFNDCSICLRTRRRKPSLFSLQSAQMGPGARPQAWRAKLLTVSGRCDGADPNSCACYGIRNAFPTAKVSFVAIILNWNQGR